MDSCRSSQFYEGKTWTATIATFLSLVAVFFCVIGGSFSTFESPEPCDWRFRGSFVTGQKFAHPSILGRFRLGLGTLLSMTAGLWLQRRSRFLLRLGILIFREQALGCCGCRVEGFLWEVRTNADVLSCDAYLMRNVRSLSKYERIDGVVWDIVLDVGRGHNGLGSSSV